MCVAVKYVLIHQDLHLPFMFLLCVPPTSRGFGYGIGPLSVHHHRCPGEAGKGTFYLPKKDNPRVIVLILSSRPLSTEPLAKGTI